MNERIERLIRKNIKEMFDTMTKTTTNTTAVDSPKVRYISFPLPNIKLLKNVPESEKDFVKDFLNRVLVEKKPPSLTYEEINKKRQSFNYIFNVLLKEYHNPENSKSYKKYLQNLILQVFNPTIPNSMLQNFIIRQNNNYAMKIDNESRAVLITPKDLKNKKKIDIINRVLYQVWQTQVPDTIKRYNEDKINGSGNFPAYVVASLTHKFESWYAKACNQETKSAAKEKVTQNIDKGILHSILKDPETAERFRRSNETIVKLMSKKMGKKPAAAYNAIASGLDNDEILSKYKKLFKDRRDIQDTIRNMIKSKKFKEIIDIVYPTFGLDINTTQIEDWSMKTLQPKQSELDKLPQDDFGGIFEIRMLIRKYLDKLFD